MITPDAVYLEFEKTLEQDEVPAELRCASCKRLAVQAMKLPCCDAAVCSSCSETLDHDCPICDSFPLDRAELKPNKTLQVGVIIWLQAEYMRRNKGVNKIHQQNRESYKTEIANASAAHTQPLDLISTVKDWTRRTDGGFSRHPCPGSEPFEAISAVHSDGSSETTLRIGTNAGKDRDLQDLRGDAELKQLRDRMYRRLLSSAVSGGLPGEPDPWASQLRSKGDGAAGRTIREPIHDVECPAGDDAAQSGGRLSRAAVPHYTASTRSKPETASFGPVAANSADREKCDEFLNYLKIYYLTKNSPSISEPPLSRLPCKNIFHLCRAVLTMA